MNAVTDQQLVAIPPQGQALAIFTSDEGKDLDPLLAEIREKIDAFVPPSVDAKKGRDEIASFAFKVVRSKTALENVGKALAAEAKLIPGKIDASRRKINRTLDAWAAEVRAPLTEWEVAEDARIKAHRAAIDGLNSWVTTPPSGDLQTLRDRVAATEAFVIGPACEEFEAEYARAKDAALRTLRGQVAWREQYEAEQAELARLKAAEAEREKRVAAEAAAAAKVERERLAKEREARAAAEAVENERRRAEHAAERERQETERRAQAERDAAERRERELREQAEAAERRAVEHEARVKREADEAIAAAERRAVAQAEGERQEAEKREANKRHNAAVNRKARDALMAGGLAEDVATLAVQLIASRKVPAVSISY